MLSIGGVYEQNEEQKPVDIYHWCGVSYNCFYIEGFSVRFLRESETYWISDSIYLSDFRNNWNCFFFD